MPETVKRQLTDRAPDGVTEAAVFILGAWLRETRRDEKVMKLLRKPARFAVGLDFLRVGLLWGNEVKREAEKVFVFLR